jgi:uncharacterized iron-regulated membrane protein
MRDKFLFIHRWIGITAGVIFGIASLTGAILVYEPELDQWLNAGRYPVTPGVLDGAALDAAVTGAAGEGILRGIQWPTPRRPVFSVDVRDDGRAREILLDPGTGSVIEPTRGENRVIRGIRRVHTQLFAGRPGKLDLEIACYAALIGILTGAILWWPGIRKIGAGLLIRMRRGTYILNYDIHQSTGILFLPLLFVLTLTGVMIPMAGFSESVGRLFMPGSEGPRGFPNVQSTPGPVIAATTSIEQLILTAQRMTGASDIDAISFPETERGFIDIRVRTGPALAAGRVVRVLVDQYNGDVLQVRNPAALAPAVQFARSGVYNIHIGAIGGPIVRVIWFIACIVGFVLMPTGLVVWWMKRTRKAKSAEQREAMRERHAA